MPLRMVRAAGGQALPGVTGAGRRRPVQGGLVAPKAPTPAAVPPIFRAPTTVLP